MVSVAQDRPVTGTDAGKEAIFAAVLAEIVGVERVAVDSHFFDDLGADSLMMAHFCARVRKRPDLPAVSMKEVYAHPTIRRLATALDTKELAPDPAPTAAPTAGEAAAGPAPTSARPAPVAAVAPIGTARYVLCGMLQALSVFGYFLLIAAVTAPGFAWIVAGAGPFDLYLRAVLLGGAGFIGLCTLPIVAKWLLIGRWRAQHIRLWSLAYVRFWVVKTLIQSCPLVLFVGSPLYVLYLRALGATIGRDVVILSTHVPVCTDLLTISSGTVIRKDAFFNGYRARAGVIETGPVTIGRDAFVGEATVLDIDTALGDGAQLGHASALHAGQAIPAGERRHGSPALQRTAVDYRVVGAAACGTPRRVAYAGFQLVTTFLITVPLAIGGVLALSALVSQLRVNSVDASPTIASWTFVGQALAFSFVLCFGLILAGLLVALTVPRLLNLAIAPDTVYPLYGLHFWAHRAIARLTNMAFFPHLFGDSSYIVVYLRWLGYDLSQVKQTGTNFGLEMKHETPYHVSIGTGTMATDGLSIMNADYSNSSFQVSPATIGADSFLGNYIAFPAHARTGDDCLLGTKVMVPVDGEVRQKAGLLGSPDFPIPRSVERDRAFDALAYGDEFGRRLSAKNTHNALTIGLFLLSSWIFLCEMIVVAGLAATLFPAIGTVAFALAGFAAIVLYVAHFGLVERLSTIFRPLQPRFCSIYDPAFWRHERYWKLAMQPSLLDGTPFKGLAWRLLGVKVGSRLYDDGCTIMDKSLVAIGDDCALNAGSIIQPHSQEDGTFKSDRIAISAGCTLGAAALVHYGVTMGDGAELAPDSFLMKGEDVPSHARWGGNPASALPAERGDGTGCRGRSRSMTMTTEAGRAFWREVLLTGEATVIPRWSRDPAGIAAQATPIPDGLAAAVRRRAEELGLPLSAALLAAHARVLAALSGEPDVVTGYVAVAGGQPLPCRLTTEPRSWRALLLDVGRREAALHAHQAFAVDALQRELGLTGPAFETVFDPTGGEHAFAEETVLWVGVAHTAGSLELRLRHRTEAVDADYAARIAGYHLTALAQLAAGPAAAPGPRSLLSAAEIVLQREGLAGPRRELPNRRAHEIFEARVRAHPDAVAAEHGDQCWTYRELNARANRLGRALLARGLGREGVVAVVTERNLDWLAAVLAILKAGGVYLPIEPRFPADRIATMLRRAGCGLVLTERGSTATLDQALAALPGVQTMSVDMADAEDHADGNLGVEVAPDQLAYIYFTSGSTGEPKGAMCEHAGMLNHLYAKIEDLAIGEGEVVAQIAPQCFDISLWQLIAALLVGGRTLLIDQAEILDVERFVDCVDNGRVAVLQVVPSYLDVVVSYLEQFPRPLPHLHVVSVTGEALPMALTRRWFAVKPGITLVNAYGLTETSDDTNHEVMDRAPVGERVPLGSPINNVRVYVVDEQLALVPLGAAGEIVFSGICVGRGYVNDPDRTRLAYLADPHHAGARLYRSGDRGRWLPDGKLEFLGRGDTQVKIRGFRIEIGEIENTLLRTPGVRQAAVVVAEASQQHLVAFYSGRQHASDVLRDQIGASLPAYMVPTTCHWRDELPLTANGKVDKKALTALAGELGRTGQDRAAPSTPAERRLATAWATVLGLDVDQIGRGDHFFDRGGTSLSAVQLVIALDRAVSLKEVTSQPVLADLAQLIASRSGAGSGLVSVSRTG